MFDRVDLEVVYFCVPLLCDLIKKVDYVYFLSLSFTYTRPNISIFVRT